MQDATIKASRNGRPGGGRLLDTGRYLHLLKGSRRMRLRGVICGFAVALALAPVGALASTPHSQSELDNAKAQLAIAQLEVDALAAQGVFDGMNARQIAFAKSELLRQKQLDDSANAAALQQLAGDLAAQIRASGDANARNELAILQIKASGLIVKADTGLANAYAMGRPDEIANAEAQSAAWHQLVDYLTGTLAQLNQSSAEISADDAASMVEGDATVEVENAEAMGANDLFAADTILEAANLDVQSAAVSEAERGAAILAHAEDSLANAEEMNVEAH